MAGKAPLHQMTIDYVTSCDEQPIVLVMGVG